MNLSRNERAQLDELLDLLAADSLDDAERLSLNQLLRSSEEAQYIYLDYFSMHAAVAFHASVQPFADVEQGITGPGQTRQVSAIGDSLFYDPELAQHDRHLGGAASPAPTEPKRPHVLHFLGRAVAALNQPIVWSVLAVALTFYGTFALIAWNLKIGQRNAAVVQGTPDKPAAIATFVSAEGCRWRSQSAPPQVGESLPVGELQLETGLAEIEFNNGARVALEGPARFELISVDCGHLQDGKLAAIVPKRATGFTVSTPMATIVDLGTEFGVEVSKEGTTDVEVVVGKVDVHYESAANSNESKRSTRMTAGAARRFSNRTDGKGVGVTSIAPWVGNTAGAQRLSQNRSLPAETKYAAAVLADHPLGYWRFSDRGKETAADASGNGLFGEYHGFVSTTSSGINASTNDRSIRFLGHAIPGWIKINNVELALSFTIELWARSATPEWNTFGWPFSSDYSANGILIHPQRGSRVLNFFVIDDQKGIYNAAEFAPENIADRFHHYVFAFDAESNRGWMYFDGQLVNERTNVLPDNHHRQLVRLAVNVGRQCDCPDRCGEGWIDELAIYPHILSADAVRRHYAAAEMPATDAESKEPVLINE